MMPHGLFKNGCCCKVASVVSDSVQPHRQQPTRLPCPWASPGKSTGVGCHFFLQCMKVKSESEVSQSCLTLSDPMDCSPSGSTVMGFTRQEHWNGLPLPSPKWVGEAIYIYLLSINKALCKNISAIIHINHLYWLTPRRVGWTE